LNRISKTRLIPFANTTARGLARCSNTSLLLAISILLMLMSLSVQGQSVDGLPLYKPRQKVSGLIRIWGHGNSKDDYIKSLVVAWEKEFRRYQPDVQFENTLLGTASAIGSLYEGAGDIAIMGREIWPEEVAAFKEVLHYPPLGIDILTGSLDIRNKDYALVVFVHRDNPITKLSLAELDSVFGCERRRGEQLAKTWSDLGLKGEWAGKPIHVYGYEISRGFGYYFQQVVFKGGSRWNPDMRELGDLRQPDGSLLDAGQRILNALGNDPYGIAYSSLKYANPNAKPIAVGDEQGNYFPATRETVFEREYPLTRTITAFVNRDPGQRTDPKIREFLRYVLSKEGQQQVLRDGGYLPLTSAATAAERKKLD
jgi:phosphate transport system substrate-binding protein